jgi:hypothetical protein
MIISFFILTITSIFLFIIVHKNKKKHIKQAPIKQTHQLTNNKPCIVQPYIIVPKAMFGLEPNKYFIEKIQNKQYILKNGIKIKIKKTKNCKVVGITPSLNMDRNNHKRRSTNISKIFSNKWQHEIGQYLFNSNKYIDAKCKHTDIELHCQQINKLKKLDHQEKCRRGKKEKKILDRQYIDFLKIQQEENKQINTGHELWKIIKKENLQEFVIPLFITRQVDLSLTIDIYQIILKYLKLYLTQMVNPNDFFFELRKINDKKISNLAGKIYRLSKDKNKKRLVYTAIDQITTYLKLHNVSNITLYSKINTQHISEPITYFNDKLHNQEKFNQDRFNQDKNQEVFDENYLKKYEIDQEEIQRKTKKEAGKSHENDIDQIISKFITKDTYLTEEDMNNCNRYAGKKYKAKPYLRTPDYLFNNTIKINGAAVKWIDCKKCVIFDMLTPQEEIDDYRAQINDYCRMFGPGLIVFHRPSFENTFDLYDKPEMISHMMLNS